MSKNNIAQQYNSMVASIEDAKIYDGRGEYNLYECNKCNNYKVTLYKDKGVTPFIMRCKCGGDMMHTKSSKQAPPSYVKVYNWVRPNLEQTMSLSEGMRNHIIWQFVEKLAEHGNGIALLFNRCDSNKFQDIIFTKATGMMFLRNRIKFFRPDGTRGDSPGCGSVLIAFGRENAEILRNCSLQGKYVELNNDK